VIAALYVETGGAYFGLDGVDPWDEERDARLYAGPFSVVAHPPCNRWSIMALARPELTIGDDDGCFAAALAAVRVWGGVLEHPAHSLAWRARHFDLPTPPPHGWTRSLFDDGWVCQVDQGLYGHGMRKLTWLYAVGVELPEMRWGDGGKRTLTVRDNFGGGKRQRHRSITPPDFRDALLGMARTTRQPVTA
jgi:hypothetical protein